MKEYFEMYSNLAFNIAGLISLYFYQDVMICLAFQALGIGSFVYHSDKSEDRQDNVIWKFDWWAIAFMNIVLTGYHLEAYMDVGVWWYLIIFHMLYGYLLLGKITSVYLEVGLSSLPALIAIFLNKGNAIGIIILSVFVLALWLRSKDKDPKQLKFHDSVWHSIWHILAAIGYYMAFHLDI
jgi:hypothetical protein